MKKIGPYKKLGTHWWFELFDNDKTIESAGGIEVIERILLTEMDRFESTYSRFLSHSLISQLNNERELKNPSKEFLDLLQTGISAHNDTHGVFNITAGGVLESHGYDPEYSFTKQEKTYSLENPHTAISFEEQGNKESDMLVRLEGEARIDFGGFGKGYLIDVLAKKLQEQGVGYFLINGGGDMYVTSDNGKPVEIILQDPRDKNKAIGTIEIKEEAFAASSPHMRRWGTDNTQTHLVSEQHTELSSVFVLAKSAIEADIWATTLSIDQNTPVPPNIEFTIL